ncbi:hypothetical protein [Xanthobacter sp. 126]|uniref:hypothetical protein n=1 Tax=Xanthobacter sp. 126 TaxID=1131814 RepID=UPI00045E6293|nr:hypothetical protein [Xanthobacter sp. 126]
MTITINVPVFPLRKEIDARKRRLRLPLSFSSRGSKAGDEAPANSRYTEAGLEFDVTGIARHPRGPKGN